MSSARRAQVIDCTNCGDTVVGYSPGNPCPGCGRVILDG
ncbi:MAG: rubrerythrin [Haloarculaceae archaeon]|jgi:rubrerythrin